MVARLVANGVRTPENVATPEELAAARAREDALPVYAPEGCSVEEVDANGVAVLRVVPDGELRPATLLYLHGGGYLWSRPAEFLPVMAAIARAARAPVLGVDYRLAPEHPFPAPVDDAVTAYRWTLDQGVPASSVVIAGDSAGGGLVIAALVALRDGGIQLPAAGASISPWIDLALTGDSIRGVDDPICTPRGLEVMAQTYLAGASPEEPTASPLYADLTGLPPLHIQVGTREALLDDSRRLAQRARQAGVEVTLIEHEDVVHQWLVYDPTIPEAQDAYREIAEFTARVTTSG
jgi:acetyl esterase/lipase